MDTLEHRRSTQAALITTARIKQILQTALPADKLRSSELLPHGASNLNYLLQFNDATPPAVLRIYIRDPAACKKELEILRSAPGLLPIPEILYANPDPTTDIGPHILYRFAEGITFQELKSSGNSQDIAEAAYAIGKTLARVQTIALSPDIPTREISDDWLNSTVLEQRIGGHQRGRLRAFLSPWIPRLRSLTEHRTLVHGDFNNRNTIVKRDANRWTVSAILDWELAFAGSPLWDAARFICYEQRDRPQREPHFSNGYRDAGGNLPNASPQLARAINTFTAAEGLSSPDLPALFTGELCDLIGAFLDHRDAA